MLRICTFAAALCCLIGAQTADAVVVFSESFGTDGGGSSLDSFTGYDNGAPVSFSSIDGADVRDSSASTGAYPGASGGNNVFLSDNTEGFIIGGIDTSGFSDLFLSFGGNEAVGGLTGLDTSVLTVEFSTNGTDFTNVPFSAGNANGWSSVKMASAAGSIAASSTLTLRFTSTVPSTQDLRIDDVAIEGTAVAVPEPSVVLFGSLLATGLGLTIARRPQSRD